MGPHIQEEIIIDILSLLPVESLLRFKCVSKFWNILISSSYFKKQHLNKAKMNHNFQKLLISQICYKDDVPNYSSFSCCCLSMNIQVVQKLDGPLNCETGHGKVYCCYDGLFFIGLWSAPAKKPSILILWNPSTRESILLPPSDYSTIEKYDESFGLGYDSTSDDYKILKVNEDDMLNEIFSVKNACWRKLADKSCRNEVSCLSRPNQLAFLHGEFHWLGYPYPEFIVVSFNISNETYRDEALPMPMCLTLTEEDSVVSVLDEMLCVYSTCLDTDTCDFWVMKHYGAKDSWTKMLTMPAMGFSFTVPRYRFANDEVLLSCQSSDASLFRTSKGPFISWPDRVLDDIDEYDIEDVNVYTQTLISPKLITNHNIYFY